METPKNPSSPYVRGNSNAGNYLAHVHDGKPWFTYWDVPRMMRDPWVNFLVSLWSSPFQQVVWTAKANRQDVAKFVDSTLKVFWQKHLPPLLRKYFQYGYAPGGLEYCVKKNRWELEDIQKIEPHDARAHEFQGKHRGKFAGFTTNSTVFVGAPYAFWFAGFTEVGVHYDRPPIAGMFDPWLEANTRGGAKHLRQLKNRKFAIAPTVVYYPPGQSAYVDRSGNTALRDNQEIALSAIEHIDSGANIAIESVYDDKGHRMFEISRVSGGTESPSVDQYPKDLKQEMCEGARIPWEVVQAAESGSSFGGRRIPMLAWLGSCDEMATLIVQAFQKQCLDHLVRINFGRGAEFEIELVSLVKQAKEEDKGGPGQQSQGGGQPPPQPQQGKPNAGGWSRQDGPRGGKYEVNASGQKRAFQMSATEVAMGPPVSDSQSQTRARKLAMLAIMQLQEEAHATGNPAANQHLIDAMAELSSSPEDLLSVSQGGRPFDMSWNPYGTSRSGSTRWKDSDTGKVRYQQSRPGEHTENRARATASAAAAAHLTSKVMFGTATHDDLRDLATHISAMPVANLRNTRASLMASFKNATRRDAMVAALIAHVQNEHENVGKDRDDDAPTAYEARQAKAESAAKEPVAAPAATEPEVVASSGKEPHEMTKASSGLQYKNPDEWEYRKGFPKGEKPQKLIDAESELDEAYNHASKFNALHSDPRMRSPKPESKKAYKRWQDAVEMKAVAANEWHETTNSHDARHKLAVAAALAAGKPVPPEVLADYPDLAPKAPAAPATPKAAPDIEYTQDPDSKRHHIQNIVDLANHHADGGQVLSGAASDAYGATIAPTPTPEQAASIKEFKSSSALNRYNRKRETHRPGLDKMNADIDAVIQSAPPIPSDLTVFRAVDSSPEFQKTLVPGYEYTDPAHNSTSIDTEYAKSTLGGDYSEHTMMQIRVPAGSKGLYAGAIHPKFAHEKELILPRNGTYKVVSVHTMGNGKYVVADYVPAAAKAVADNKSPSGVDTSPTGDKIDSVGTQSADPKPEGKTMTAKPVGWSQVLGNSFEHKDAIKAAGGQWDSVNKTWRVPSRNAATIKDLPGLQINIATATAKADMPSLQGRNADVGEEVRDKIVSSLEHAKSSAESKGDVEGAAKVAAIISKAAAVVDSDLWHSLSSAYPAPLVGAILGNQQDLKDALAHKNMPGKRRLIEALTGGGTAKETPPATPSPVAVPEPKTMTATLPKLSAASEKQGEYAESVREKILNRAQYHPSRLPEFDAMESAGVVQIAREFPTAKEWLDGGLNKAFATKFSVPADKAGGAYSETVRIINRKNAMEEAEKLDAADEGREQIPLKGIANTQLDPLSAVVGREKALEIMSAFGVKIKDAPAAKGGSAVATPAPAPAAPKVVAAGEALPALLAMASANIKTIVAMSPEEHKAAVDSVDSLNAKELQQLASANNIAGITKGFSLADKKTAIKQAIRDRLGIYHRGSY